MQNELPQELEGKWLVRDLSGIENHLLAMNASLVHERVLETNLRFDDDEGSLRSSFKVLRLRRDEKVRLTYKGPKQLYGGIAQSTEIEFHVSDFDAAKNFLEALGYSVYFIYEKYRQEYRLGECLVMLDELPYGNFVEIEGRQVDDIHSLADALGLDWNANSLMNYNRLFDHFNQQCGNLYHNLTFNEFAGRTVTPTMLGLRYADGEE